ncbi:hypothetical protein VTK26DRAFT_7729 [Humicola hyalothermophila]
MAWTERSKPLFACSVVLYVLSATAVALRFIARFRILRVSGPSDWFILLTLLFASGNTICVALHANYGLGRHMADLLPDEQVVYYKVLFTAVIVGNISLVLTKISVLLLFLDIFVLTWIRKATYLVMAMAILGGLWMILSTVFFCIPPEDFWNITAPDRRCLLGPTKWSVDAGLNLGLEVIIFCMPIPVVRFMKQMRPSQKVWVFIIFLLGFLVCLISLIRFYFLYFEIASDDLSWTGVDITYWSTVEINLPIIISCIPMLTPLVRKRSLRSEGRQRDIDGLGDGLYPPTISSPPIRLSSRESHGFV